MRVGGREAEPGGASEVAVVEVLVYLGERCRGIKGGWLDNGRDANGDGGVYVQMDSMTKRYGDE